MEEQSRCRLLWGNYEENVSPCISIVMPIYNKYEYLEIAIKSALNQDFSLHYEIVIVDNNQQNNNYGQQLVSALNDSRIFYYKNSDNLGMVGNWNQCAKMARSEWIVYLHDDDMLSPQALSILYKLICNKKAIFAKSLLIDGDGCIRQNEIRKWFFPFVVYFIKKMGWETYSVNKFDLLLSAMSTGVGALYNRQCILYLGGYNPNYYPSHDYRLNFEYVAKYGGIFTNNVTAYLRVADNTSFLESQKYPDVCERIRLDNLNLFRKIVRPLMKLIIKCQKEYDRVNCEVCWNHNHKTGEMDYSKLAYGFIKYLNRCNMLKHLIMK